MELERRKNAEDSLFSSMIMSETSYIYDELDFEQEECK